MVGLHERAEEKLAVYRDEAALRRALPTGLWRVRLAAVLREMAGRLEAADPRPDLARGKA